MCHLLEFKYGTLNKWGTRLHYQQPKESFSLMFVYAPRLLCPPACVRTDGMRVYYSMYVCVCETSFRYTDDNENI